MAIITLFIKTARHLLSLCVHFDYISTAVPIRTEDKIIRGVSENRSLSPRKIPPIPRHVQPRLTTIHNHIKIQRDSNLNCRDPWLTYFGPYDDSGNVARRGCKRIARPLGHPVDSRRRGASIPNGLSVFRYQSICSALTVVPSVV
jgi:hypothetical protein